MGGEGGNAVSSGVGMVEVVDLICGSQGCALRRAHKFVLRWKEGDAFNRYVVVLLITDEGKERV